MSKLAKIHLFIIIASVSALIFAYISQYFFDLKPCILCHYQRIIYWSILANSLFCYFKYQKVGYYLALLLIVGNIGVAGFHSGVEHKIFTLNTCSATGIDNTSDVRALAKQLQSLNAVRCDRPQLVVLGLSMAEWNALYLIALLSLSIVFPIYNKSYFLD